MTLERTWRACSNVERLGEKGKHARTAIGCSTLPNNNAVTLEAIARVGG